MAKFTYLICCKCARIKRRYHWHVKCQCGHEMTKSRCGCTQWATLESAMIERDAAAYREAPHAR
jgi:hypothetical protein